MKNRLTDENGMVIVEASIVFPVMFLIIFLMLFAGNAYWQMCRVEAIANNLVIDGAAYCADSMLNDIEAGKQPTVGSIDINPYRYIFTGGMDKVRGDIEDKLKKRVSGLNTGLFSGMKPRIRVANAAYNNGFIYSTLSVELLCEVTIPVRLLGSSDFTIFKIANHIDMPVTDTTEFIKNADMVKDYMDRFGVTEKINELIGKVKELFKKSK